MIKFRYPKLALDKARSICARVEQAAGTQHERDRLCQEDTGLTHRYLSRVGTIHRTPSNRTLLNMGFELWLVDPETGNRERVDLVEDSPCDWNPANPRMRASSTDSSAT